jgi:hypothetical protein
MLEDPGVKSVEETLNGATLNDKATPGENSGKCQKCG